MKRQTRKEWTDFALLRESCGLTQEDTAALLDLTIDQVRSYDIGRRKPELKTMIAFKKLFLIVERAARFGRGAKGAIARGIARRTFEMAIMKRHSRDRSLM